METEMKWGVWGLREILTRRKLKFSYCYVSQFENMKYFNEEIQCCMNKQYISFEFLKEQMCID